MPDETKMSQADERSQQSENERVKEPYPVNTPTTAVNAKPRGRLTVQLLTLPAHTNANGDIFGGWVVSQMDIASGIIARDTSQGRAATVAIDAMTFIRPVKVGDILCVYTALERIGRTSMTIYVEASAQRFLTKANEKVTNAVFTFVAIDDSGRPRPVLRHDTKVLT
jgi:acyl-CoA thioesterase YciA